MKVPFVDLPAQQKAIRTEIDEAVAQVMQSGAFAGGPFVARFEEEFSRFCGTPHVVGVGSGTEALWMALVAFGVGRGDEVITVPNSFIATAEAVTMSGAKPVFVDVSPVTYTMDVSRIEEAITRRTRAIIPVHIFGQTADMGPIMDIARERGLVVIEDACQAHGAEYKGRKAGTIGDAGCFSFYPGKNLGACGEAGAVVSARREIAERIGQFRDHGQTAKYHHAVIGWNGRMDGLQGAILEVKLRHLPAWNAARRAAAREYGRALAGADGLLLPTEAAYALHVYHIYAVRTRARDGILEDLRANGVQCGIHYPVPIHLQRAYRDLGYGEGAFPVAEQCAREFLSLPLFPEITSEQIAFTAASLREGLAKTHAA